MQCSVSKFAREKMRSVGLTWPGQAVGMCAVEILWGMRSYDLFPNSC